jgi:hypothetical protein
MATDIVQSLFGVTPEMYQQRQAAAADERALALAQLTPMQRAEFNIGRGAYQLAGALGGPDPQLQMISARNALAKQIDFNDPASIQAGVKSLTQAGDTQGAMMLADTARKALESGALVQQRGAERMTPEQRNAMAYAAGLGLRPGTEEYRTAYLAKFEELTAKAGRTETFGAEREAVARELYGKPVSQLTQPEIAAVNKRVEGAGKPPAVGGEAERVALAEFDKPFAQLSPEQRRKVNATVEAQGLARAQAGAAVSPIAVVGPSGAPMFVSREQAVRAGMTPATEARQFLPPSLQKDESKDIELVDSLTMRRESLKEPLTLLTPDPATKKPPLELGPAKNAGYMARNATGNSTPESRAYAALQRAVQEATNLKTDAAKGVQTDKDVLRFANELTAAFGKYDTKTTLEALTNFNKATQSALEKTQARIDTRRRSQGVAPFYGTSTAPKGTPENPIKLD